MTIETSESPDGGTPNPALWKKKASTLARDSGALEDLGPGRNHLRPKRKRQASLRELRDKILADLDRARLSDQNDTDPEDTPEFFTPVFSETAVSAMLSISDDAFRQTLTDASLGVSHAHSAVGRAEWERTRSIAEFAELFRIAELRAQPSHPELAVPGALPHPHGPSTEDSDFFHRAVAAEVAAAVHESQTQARELVTQAVHIMTELPCASEAHRQGTMGSRHLRVIVESTIGAEASHARLAFLMKPSLRMRQS